MSDVVDRIVARLEAMEAAARAAEDDGYGEWEYAIVHQSSCIQTVRTAGSSPRYQEHLAITHDSEGLSDSVSDHAGPHIALNDPAAVLRIVAGLRAVVALHIAPSAGMPGGVYDPECNHEGYGLPSPEECETLRIIAAMFPADPTEATP